MNIFSRPKLSGRNCGQPTVKDKKQWKFNAFNVTNNTAQLLV